MAAVQREIGTESRQADVFEQQTANQQCGHLQREHGQPDERHEGDQTDARPGQGRRQRGGDDRASTTRNTPPSPRPCIRANTVTERTASASPTPSIAIAI